jgi:hypothetical protein
MTFIKLTILLLFCFITIKMGKWIAVLVKSGHGVSTVFVSPIKRMFIWEYNNFRVLLMNLFYSKADVFKSLVDNNEIGVVRKNDNNMLPNKILRGLFHLTWQTLAIIVITTHSWSGLVNILPAVKFNCFILFLSIVTVTIYVRLKTMRVKTYKDKTIKSTMPFIGHLSKNKQEHKIK